MKVKRYRIIEESELHDLIQDSLTLSALEMGGVDNWEWESDSRHDLLEQMRKDAGLDPKNEDYDFDYFAEKDVALYDLYKEEVIPE